MLFLVCIIWNMNMFRLKYTEKLLFTCKIVYVSIYTVYNYINSHYNYKVYIKLLTAIKVLNFDTKWTICYEHTNILWLMISTKINTTKKIAKYSNSQVPIVSR